MSGVGKLCAAGFLALSPLLAGAASAQQNELRILQEGERNTLFVDQSDAAESTVGGLGSPRSGLSTSPEGSALTGPALALPSRLDLSPFRSPDALQIGSDNTARVDDDGTGNRIVLQQVGRPNGGANEATIAVNSGGSQAAARSMDMDVEPALATEFLQGGGSNTAFALQNGNGNSADVNIDGTGSLGGLAQQGSGNTAALAVIGSGISGVGVQIGDDNDLGLVVQGTAGSDVSFTQIGNGITNAAAPSIVTNGATVVITQQSFAQ
ncbi:hypothetical protein U0C82_04000 [Fulvimarina sp. 2208YS6-2-32]|uniref:Curlin associated repeat-containing protein n=1 Tax=Fulvimarina uroteuthidis TaxID=3098149 RepID=A0ABU5HYW4_9HYPH|nr:hypothetical protein [Fulvimarina sp. 2208YS6-2-32]MDY8108313.1 hypothetical protein [Fulvimarina sp. 2208YS6-2-32]